MSGHRTSLKVAVKSAKRNYKRTIFLIALIALPVAVAVFAGGAMRAASISADERAVSDFGGANVRIEGQQLAPEVVDWMLGEVDDVDPNATHLSLTRRFTSAAGPSSRREPIYLLDVDLGSPLAEGIVTLIEGRSPTAVSEIAISGYSARRLGVGVGDTVAIRDGSGANQDLTVVGMVSHPILWRQYDAVVTAETLDSLASGSWEEKVILVSTEQESEVNQAINQAWERDRYQFYPDHVEWPMPPPFSDFLWEDVYVALSAESLTEVGETYADAGPDAAIQRAYELADWTLAERGLPYLYSDSRAERLERSRETVIEQPPVVATAVAAVLLVEVSFIAGAAFAAGTRRRLREIGLMGANGASTKHMRTTVVGEGLLAGLLGGILGGVLGAVALLIGRPYLQLALERRIEEYPLVPVDLIGPLVMAVIACAIAAWIPARTAAAVPTLTALQGRMPVADPKRRTVVIALVLAVVGTLLLGAGLATQTNGGGAIATVGVLLMIGGVALLSGPLVAFVARRARHFGVTPRIVLRDSGRHRSRSAAAVAATMVILIAPVAALAANASAQASEDVYGLPPSSPQATLWGRLDSGNDFNLVSYPADDRAAVDHDMAAIAGAVEDLRTASFVVLDDVVHYPAEWQHHLHPELEGDSTGVSDPTGLVRVAVANPELVDLLGSPAVQSALERDGMVLIGVTDRVTEIGLNGEAVTVTEVGIGVQREMPRLLVSETRAATMGKPVQAIGLAIQSPQLLFPWSDPWQPVHDLNLEVQMSTWGGSQGMDLVLPIVFLFTLMVVLIVVATITALSAAEADGDLQTMVAVGAPNSIRRKYLGLQSFMHTFLGALLAVPLALVLVKTVIGSGWHFSAIGFFGVYRSWILYIPWAGLAAMVVGLPIVIGLFSLTFTRSSPLVPPRRAF